MQIVFFGRWGGTMAQSLPTKGRQAKDERNERIQCNLMIIFLKHEQPKRGEKTRKKIPIASHNLITEMEFLF